LPVSFKQVNVKILLTTLVAYEFYVHFPFSMKLPLLTYAEKLES